MSDYYYTTRSAAKVLLVSVGTIQKMVDSGTLVSWRTSGGHRRITPESVQSYIDSNSRLFPSNGKSDLSVLLISSDSEIRAGFDAHAVNWNINLKVFENLFSALLQISKQQPHVFVMDLDVSPIDFSLLVDALKQDKSLRGIDLIALKSNGQSEMLNKNDMPKNVTILNKPVPFDTLQGYFLAKKIALFK